MSRLRRPVITIFFLLAISFGFLFGVVKSDTWTAYAKDRYQELQIFTKVLNLVQQYYVEEIDTKKLIYGGIKGMLQELDPHTNFLAPELYKEFESETSGEFGGLGIEITLQNDILTVISPIEDTPAWEAGILAGDKIVEVNGESTKGLSLAEAAQKMRGKRGSKIRLGIFREGFERPKEFAIERGVVKIRSVKHTDLGDGYGYMRLTSFIENTSSELEKAIKAQEKASKDGIKGLLIDLRRNPGGLLDQAIKISDLFLESGTIVSTIGRNKRDKEVVYAKKEGTYGQFPVIVLINEASASASEIVAGALQDNHRALIMGQTSFGKGSVQSVVKLGDGSALKLTVARYYTPNGVSIQAEGIKPDVVVDNVDPEAYRKAVIKNEGRREQDISNHLKGDREQKESENQAANPANKGGEEVSFWWTKEGGKRKPQSLREKLLGEDFQVMQAFNYLRAWKVMESYGKGTGGMAPALADLKTKAEEEVKPMPTSSPAPAEEKAPAKPQKTKKSKTPAVPKATPAKEEADKGATPTK